MYWISLFVCDVPWSLVISLVSNGILGILWSQWFLLKYIEVLRCPQISEDVVGIWRKASKSRIQWFQLHSIRTVCFLIGLLWCPMDSLNPSNLLANYFVQRTMLNSVEANLSLLMSFQFQYPDQSVILLVSADSNDFYGVLIEFCSMSSPNDFVRICSDILGNNWFQRFLMITMDLDLFASLPVI